MKNFLLTALILLTALPLFSQDLEKYRVFAHEAEDLLFESKNYEESAKKYKMAFDQMDGKAYAHDRYNAACAYAMSGDKEEAYYHLFYLAEKVSNKYTDIDHISQDEDLISLHDDERWETLLKIVRENKVEAEKLYDRELIAQLDIIFQDDQNLRVKSNEVQEKYGWDSDEMKNIWKEINVKDSINLNKVKKILDERGWLGPQIVGPGGNTTLFLVIQHADLETQKKYLPMMREAVENGNAGPSDLALLEDRVALGIGEKQIYGSQLMIDNETGEYYVSPMIDPDNVNKRRSEVGLGTIEEYISMWGLEWDVEEYKRKLPEYEAKQKNIIRK